MKQTSNNKNENNVDSFVGQTLLLDSLKPNARNPRKPWKNEKQKKEFLKSLETFGDLSGVVFNKTTGQLVGGHKRVDEFRLDKGSELIIVEQLETPDATETLAYGYIVLSSGTRFAYREVEWTAAKESAANLAANKWSAEWDFKAAALLVDDLMAGGFDVRLTGFNEDEVKGFNDDDSSSIDEKPRTTAEGPRDVVCPRCGHRFTTLN